MLGRGVLRGARHARNTLDFRFAGFEIDIPRRELRRASELVSIEPQVFDLLVHLVRNHDRIVTKDELIETVWKGRAISEAALSSRISAARRAIGDSGAEQKLIRTLNKRGFRFVGAVQAAGKTTIPVAQRALSQRARIRRPSLGPTGPRLRYCHFKISAAIPSRSTLPTGLPRTSRPAYRASNGSRLSIVTPALPVKVKRSISGSSPAS